MWPQRWGGQLPDKVVDLPESEITGVDEGFGKRSDTSAMVGKVESPLPTTGT